MNFIGSWLSMRFLLRADVTENFEVQSLRETVGLRPVDAQLEGRAVMCWRHVLS